MSEISLYKMCLKRVYDLVKAGTWKSCSINPFLNFPSEIVNDLMTSSGSDIPTTSDVFLLLASGSLTHLHISSYKLWLEYDLFLKAIRANGFRSLRVLTWHSSNYKHIPLIENLIRSCPKLEEFHSNQYVNFEFFFNCKELRVLVFSRHLFSCDVVASSMNLAALASLKNLQVFDTSHMDSNIIAEVLQVCPQLVSLGHIDSLNCLEKIHANSKSKCETSNSEISNHFQLKSCVWGKDIEELNEWTDIASYKSKSPEKIKIAVSLCPVVEDLIIYVINRDSIESLKNLKQLTHLKISFHGFANVDEYITDFLALLKVIGPKLKYLFIDCIHRVPIDIICEYCPRLESLELARYATINMADSPPCNIFIKNLRAFRMDQNALLFLLSSCKDLVELLLCDATCLDDNLLSQILKQNPLAKLQICEITESSLTKKGFQMFLKSAVSIQRVNFASFRQDVASLFENLITELNLTNVRYGEMFDIPYGSSGYVPPYFR